jgi:hypothetical protein
VQFQWTKRILFHPNCTPEIRTHISTPNNFQYIYTYYYYYSYFFLLFTIIIIVYYWYLLLLLYIYYLLLLIIYYYKWHHILLNSCINSCIYHVYHHFSTCDPFVTLLPVSFTVELNKSGKPQARQKRSFFLAETSLKQNRFWFVHVYTNYLQLTSFFRCFCELQIVQQLFFLRHTIKKPQTRHLFKGIWVETHVISWFFH